MSVPRIAYVLPLRSRLQFTTNLLPSLVRHSSRPHEIVIVLDKTPLQYELARRPNEFPPSQTEQFLRRDEAGREQVYRWIDAHQKLLDEHGINVLEFIGDERCWTGGIRAAAAMNMGTAATSSEWVATFGDEDLVFMKNWDVALWDVLRDHDPMQFVSTPVMVTPDLRDPYPEVLTAAWIHAQRDLCCHKLTLPLPVKFSRDLLSGRLTYDTFLRFYEIGKMGGCINERCGERRMCHWVPMITHRKLFDRVGGYPTHDRAASSFDLVFDDSLRALGVTKRMPLDHMVLHTKHYVYMSDEVDREWADKTLLDSIAHDRF
jgi:hypothetical protein